MVMAMVTTTILIRIHFCFTDFKKVYLDKSECLAALKKCRGSRFKSFRTHAEALNFAQNGPVPPIHHNHQEDTTALPQPSANPSLNVEKPSPFRGPKSQDLVKFRKAIERDDMDFFTKVSKSHKVLKFLKLCI